MVKSEKAVKPQQAEDQKIVKPSHGALSDAEIENVSGGRRPPFPGDNTFDKRNT